MQDQIFKIRVLASLRNSPQFRSAESRDQDFVDSNNNSEMA